MADRGRSLMNEDQLKQWVLRKLGAPVVKVELHPSQLEDVVEDTKEWFIGQLGVEMIALLDLVSGQPAYDVPDDVDAVIDVVIPTPPFDLSLVFSPYILADEKIPYDVFAAPESAGLYSSLTQAIQYTKEAKKVLSADFDWRWNEYARKVVLSPVPRNAGKFALHYKSTDVNPEHLPQFKHNMFKEYMLAEAKETLGTIYAKYGEFPSASGERRLAGERLLGEAREAKEELNRRVRKSTFPVPFILA